MVPIDTQLNGQHLLNHCSKLMLSKVGSLSAIPRFGLVTKVTILFEVHIKIVNRLISDAPCINEDLLHQLMHRDQRLVLPVVHIGHSEGDEAVGLLVVAYGIVSLL